MDHQSAQGSLRPARGVNGMGGCIMGSLRGPALRLRLRVAINAQSTPGWEAWREGVKDKREPSFEMERPAEDMGRRRESLESGRGRHKGDHTTSPTSHHRFGAAPASRTQGCTLIMHTDIRMWFCWRGTEALRPDRLLWLGLYPSTHNTGCRGRRPLQPCGSGSPGFHASPRQADYPSPRVESSGS